MLAIAKYVWHHVVPYTNSCRENFFRLHVYRYTIHVIIGTYAYSTNSTETVHASRLYP